jgi:hypothetical protein
MPKNETNNLKVTINSKVANIFALVKPLPISVISIKAKQTNPAVVAATFPIDFYKLLPIANFV